MNVPDSHLLKPQRSPIARRLFENLKASLAHVGPVVLRWRKWWFLLLSLALFGLGLWMRLYDLGAPFDRDGYDEGVYWQSLRAIAAGGRLRSAGGASNSRSRSPGIYQFNHAENLLRPTH